MAKVPSSLLNSSSLVSRNIDNSMYDKVKSVADHMDNILVVSTDLESVPSNIEEVALNINGIKSVGTNIDAVTAIGDNIEGINKLVPVIPQMLNISDSMVEIKAVSTKLPEITNVHKHMNNVDRVGTNIDSVVTVSNITPDVLNVSTNMGAITRISNNINNVNTVATSILDINSIANNITTLLKVDDYAYNASVSANQAAISASVATTQATLATNKATIATTQAGIATTKADEASASATSASTSATTATTSATIATTQASIASTKAEEASASATSSITSANTALTAVDTATELLSDSTALLDNTSSLYNSMKDAIDVINATTTIPVSASYSRDISDSLDVGLNSGYGTSVFVDDQYLYVGATNISVNKLFGKVYVYDKNDLNTVLHILEVSGSKQLGLDLVSTSSHLFVLSEEYLYIFSKSTFTLEQSIAVAIGSPSDINNRVAAKEFNGVTTIAVGIQSAKIVKTYKNSIGAMNTFVFYADVVSNYSTGLFGTSVTFFNQNLIVSKGLIDNITNSVVEVFVDNGTRFVDGFFSKLHLGISSGNIMSMDCDDTDLVVLCRDASTNVIMYIYSGVTSTKTQTINVPVSGGLLASSQVSLYNGSIVVAHSHTDGSVIGNRVQVYGKSGSEYKLISEPSIPTAYPNIASIGRGVCNDDSKIYIGIPKKWFGSVNYIAVVEVYDIVRSLSMQWDVSVVSGASGSAPTLENGVLTIPAGMGVSSGGTTGQVLAKKSNTDYDTQWVNQDVSSGTVTSVGGTGTVSGLTLTGTVTDSGNLTLGGTLSVLPSNFASQTANYILAAPNGSAGIPTFRAIVAADIPTLNQNTTGSAATLTTGRTIGMTGDVTWTSASFNGSANVTGTATLANSGVTAGTYKSITVDAKGRVTAGTNPTTLAGYSISDAYSKTEVDTIALDKVDKVAGKQLSTEDYTIADKNKLSGLSNYTKPVSEPISYITGLQTALDSKVSKTSVEALHSTDALRISGTTLSLYKGDGTFESVVTQDTIYTLPTATSTVKGGIEIFSDTVQTTAANAISTTSGRTYGIQLNSNGQAVVNVPWSDTNTVYTLPTASATVLGGIKVGANLSIDANGVLSANDTNVSFSEISGKPTNLSGYGITDAYTKTEVDTITGDIASALDTINGEVI